MAHERFQYCQDLGYDVLAITKFWRSAEKFAGGTCRWTFGIANKDNYDNLQYPGDKESGVGIAPPI